MEALQCRRLTTAEELAASQTLMQQLRGAMARPESYRDDLRQQEAQGYELHGCFQGERLVGLAGVRRQRTMARGWHLFVDDLVTDEGCRGRGVGRALLAYLEELARAEGLPRVYLDSRDTARGFYERLGFTFLTAIPCWKAV